MEQAQARPASNGLGTAAMVVGIIALVLALIPGIGLVSIILGPVALILGIIAVTKKDLPNGAAKAGIATGILAILVCIAWLVYFGMRAAADRGAGSGSSSSSITGTIGGDPAPAAASRNEGAPAAPTSSVSFTSSDLVGRWGAPTERCQFSTTFNADGTFQDHLFDGSVSHSGTWTLEGDTIMLRYSDGRSEAERIVEWQGDTYVHLMGAPPIRMRRRRCPPL